MATHNKIARIAIVDDQHSVTSLLSALYDALRSPRPYKPAFDHDKTISIMRHGDDRTKPEHFDPELLRLFLTNEKEFEKIYHRDISIFDPA